MSDQAEIIKGNKLELSKQSTINAFNQSDLPEGAIRDCFVALTMSIMGEFFMSSDTKYFIILGMISNLEAMGYSPEDIDKFKICMDKILKTFHKPNDFMG
jgi:hypothetical protein